MFATKLSILCGSVIVGLAVMGSPAFAQVATDVDCTRCIDRNNLASGAVVDGKIRAGTITGSRLRDGTITGDKIANGAITLDKVAPELSNSIGTFCPEGQAAVGQDQSGNFVCEPTGWFRTIYPFFDNSGVAAAVCPAGEGIVAVGCTCSSVSGSRNIGLLGTCDIAGNGGVAGCLFDAITFDPFLPPPRAELSLTCGVLSPPQANAVAAATNLEGGASASPASLEDTASAAQQTLRLQLDRLSKEP